MMGKWLVVLPLFVDFNKVILQPITEESNIRRVRQDLGDCCPCRDEDTGSARDGLVNSLSRLDCPCQPRDNDAEASILLPALRAIQPFVKQAEKSDPKPLLQPEVGLASSVLETLRQATDEEYQDALARDAARSAVKLFEPDISSIGDVLTETPKNVVRIFLNPKDDMDDNLPEPSHIQETRCIHSPLESVHDFGQLRMRQPTPVIEVFNSPRKLNKKLKHKNLFHRNQYEMDNGIGASNIQERVISPNDGSNIKNVRLKSTPTLLNLFSKDNADDTNDSKNVNAENTLNQKVTPKHFRLKDFVDSLDVNSNKEITKLPVIDLKKYFATTTRRPPLKFKPLDKSIFRTNKPLQLKDLLKLRDVELIPRKELTNNKPILNKSSSSNSNIKSRMSSGYKNNNNEKFVNCEDEDTNTAPSVNRDIITVGSETADSGTSPTNVTPNFISDNNKILTNNNIIQNPIPDECLDLVNDDLNSITLNPVDVGDQGNYNNGNIETDGDPNNAMINDESNRKKTNENFNNNDLEKGKIQKHESNEDIFNDESISNAYQIELLEDLNYPVEFDNSSMVPETNLNNSDNTQSKEMESNQGVLNNPVAGTREDDLQIMEQNDQQPAIPQIFFKNRPEECMSYDQFADYSNPLYDINEQNLLADTETVEDHHNIDLSNPNRYPNLQTGRHVEDLNYVHKNKKINPKLQKLAPVDHKQEHTSHVSFKDLQEMSDSLLNLSERVFYEKNMPTKSLVSKNLKEQNDDSIEIDNKVLSTDNLKQNSKETNTKDVHDNKVSFVRKSGENDIKNQGFDHCKVPLVNVETRDFNEENDNFANDLDTENSELSAEDSKYDADPVTYTKLKLSEPKMSSIKSNINDNFNSNAVSKPDITDILQNNKHSEILDNLKSKLENLFSPPENVRDVFAAPEDNVNESSNMKPIITNCDESDLNQLQRMPQTLRETFLPGLNLGSYKNKLAVPKSLDRTINLEPALNSHIGLLGTPSARRENQREHKKVQYKKPQTLRSPLENSDKLRSTLTSNPRNILNSPFELSRPFEDTWDPSLALSDLSDRLRSHTDNAIQNVKENLKSRLRDSQTVGFRRPSDTIDTNDIIESISNRRDEFNEKLQAIHSDINDRFNTFQQSVMDEFRQTTGNSEFEDDISKTGLRSNNIPLKKPSPYIEISKPGTVPKKPNLTSFLPRDVLDKSESAEKFKLPKIPGTSRFQNYDESTPNLSKNIDKLRNGILFDRHEKIPISDKKISLQKLVLPSATTARPSLIPRPKTLKSITDSVPKLNTDNSNARQSKIPVLTESKLPKPKLRLKPERINKLVEQPNSSSQSLPPRTHQSERSFKTDKVQTISSEEDSTVSGINKLRKALLQRNPDFISKGASKIPANHWHLPTSSVKNKDMDGDGGPRSSHKTDLGKNNKDVLSSLNIDSRHSAAQNLNNIQLVEPLRENVPYKCKLICYKDS